MKYCNGEDDEPPYFHHRMARAEIAVRICPFLTDFDTVGGAANREDLDNLKAILIAKRNPTRRRRETLC